MNPEAFGRFMHDSANKLRNKSDSEKVRIFANWCVRNNTEEVMLRLSSEEKGGWAKNYCLDFTTNRVIVTKKGLLTKFADLGFVAGLAPYPYLVLKKDPDPSKIRKQAAVTPDDLLKSENLSFFAWYSDIQEVALRKGMETMVTNMFGRAIVSNFLSIKTADGKRHDFRLPVNKNGKFEQIQFWLNVVVPQGCTWPDDMEKRRL